MTCGLPTSFAYYKPLGGGLADGPYAFWKMEEAASANRLDSSGNSRDMSDAGTFDVNQVAGKINNAAGWPASGSAWLLGLNDAHFNFATNFTIALWFFPTTGGAAAAGICGKWDAGTRLQYILYYGAPNVRLHASTDGSNSFNTPTAIGALDTWHLVICWHNSVDGTINIQVDNGTVASVSGIPSVFVPGTPSSWRVGRDENGNTVISSHKVDALGVWARVLTAEERTYLWNSGAGREYPF